MTPYERANPACLNSSRRARIAAGSGTGLQEVNRILKQFEQMRKMMRTMTDSKMNAMLNNMKGMNMPRG